MEAVRTWAFSVCAAMAVCGIALQILPKSNLSSVFRLVVSVFFLCCLLMPVVVNFPTERYRLEEYSTRAAEERAEALRSVAEEQAALEADGNLEKFIADNLRQMGINYHDITINISVNGQSGAEVYAEILLDSAHEPEHDRILAILRAALESEVRLNYA